ncbi:hypothetical protein HN865_03040 [Candidatus Woesearchaeota archaeon]|jgi:hypothetical protein|nr:hypothetical protein [Candidatus Woesearchaeota archaeon]MBT7237809.1 hypothetical protein [Candidatus Woesearchaeota archaeon]
MTATGKVLIWGDILESPAKDIFGSLLDLLTIFAIIFLIWLILKKVIK